MKRWLAKAATSQDGGCGCQKVSYVSRRWARRSAKAHRAVFPWCFKCRIGQVFGVYPCWRGRLVWHTGHSWPMRKASA